MGQKSNVLTLKKKQNSLNFSGNEKESIKFLHGLRFLKSFEQLLKKKNILLTGNQMNFVGNKVHLDLSLFFKVSKLVHYRKKFLKGIKNPHFSKIRNKVNKFLTREFSLLKSNFIVLKLNVINKKVNKKIVYLFYNKLKRFIGILFSRRFNFFMDFLKASSLFIEDFLSLRIYLSFLGLIFRVLQKRTHARFLLFLRTIFDLIVSSSKVKRLSSAKSRIKGLKFILNGKLKGKPRASSNCSLFGRVPNSTISKDIVFAKFDVCTLYGVFGFKAWVYKI
jgi:hypothetical protein